MRTQDLNPLAVAGDISEREIRATPETRPTQPANCSRSPVPQSKPDAEQEYFCDGITHELIHALSRISSESCEIDGAFHTAYQELEGRMKALAEAESDVFLP